MKVALITPDYPPDNVGGAAISVNLLAKNLVKKGVNVNIFAFTKKCRTKKYNGIKTYYFNNPRKLELTSLNIATFIKFKKHYNDFDLIHVYNVRQIPSISLLKIIKNKSVFATLNNLELACLNVTENLKNNCKKCGLLKSFYCSTKYLYKKNKFYVLASPIYWLQFNIGKFLAKRIDCFFAYTKGIKNIYVNAGYPADKIKVVSNILDEKFYVKKNTKKGKVTFLFVGRFDKTKGVINLIRAYSRLSNDLKEKSKLILLGRGSEEKRVRKFVRNSRLNIKIKYVNYSKLPRIYKNADILVHPAMWPEPFSRTWLEAMASETAIISSKNPSANEILKECALFVNPFDVNDLKDKIELLIKDEKLRNKLTSAGKKESKKYLPEKIIPKIIKEYERLL